MTISRRCAQMKDADFRRKNLRKSALYFYPRLSAGNIIISSSGEPDSSPLSIDPHRQICQ